MTWKAKDKVQKPFWPLFNYNFVFNQTNGVITLAGGKRSGKSWTAAHFLIFWMVALDANVSCFRKIIEKVRVSVFNELLKAIKEMGLEDLFKVNSSPMKMVYLPTGAEILFFGMNGKGGKQNESEGASLGSFTFTHNKNYYLSWQEEAFEFNPADLDYIMGSAPSCKKAIYIRTFNAWDDSKFITKSLDLILRPKLSEMKANGYKTGFGADKSYWMTSNYTINPYLDVLTKQTMIDIDKYQPDKAKAFVWGLVGRAGALTYPSMLESLKTTHIIADIQAFKFGVDYGPKHDKTTCSLIGVSQGGTVEQILLSYADSNDTHPEKFKSGFDFADDVIRFIFSCFENFPALERLGAYLYVDNHNTAFKDILKNKCKTTTYYGEFLENWIWVRDSKKPLINKRIEVFDYCFAKKTITWYLPNDKLNVDLPEMYNQTEAGFNEFYNCQQETYRTVSAENGYLWNTRRVDGGDDIINSIEYANSDLWKLLSKGTLVEWNPTDYYQNM